MFEMFVIYNHFLLSIKPINNRGNFTFTFKGFILAMQ